MRRILIALGMMIASPMYSAMKYDGVTDYAAFPQNDVFQFTNQSFTIEFWYQRNATGTQRIFTNMDAGSNGYYMESENSSGNGGIRFYCSAPTLKSASANVAGALNVWHHIAFVRQAGSEARFWVDGVRRSTITNGSDGIGSANLVACDGDLAWPRFAVDEFTSFGTVTIAEFRIWNRALTAGEINNVRYGVIGKQSGLLVNWRCDNPPNIGRVQDYNGVYHSSAVVGGLVVPHPPIRVHTVW